VRETFQFKARISTLPPLHARWATARRPTRNARGSQGVRQLPIDQGEL